MKAKFFLAAMLMLALFVGSANATPLKAEASKTSMSKSNAPVHHHHRHHHHHHMMHH